MIGFQCTCITGLQADENSQIRLETNTTNTCGFAACMASRKTADGQGNRDGSQAFRCSSGAHSQIQCWSRGFGLLAQSLTRYRPECLDYAIPGCTLLLEWPKIKLNPDTRVRFDMPSCGQTKRGRVKIEKVANADSPPPFQSYANYAHISYFRGTSRLLLECL